MSLWLDRRRRRGDEGLGLVEIIISMVILGIVLVSTTPMIIGGLQASRTATLNTAARALGQERIEKMRNLPYHVARQNGAYLDVLDLYYRDTQPSAGNAGGFDPCTTRTYANGVYSCTITNLLPTYPGSTQLVQGYRSFSQVVQTRFLDANRNVLIPPTSYDSQTAGSDMPVSNLLGVDVLTTWTQSGKTHKFWVHSQIANAVAGKTLLEASLRLGALSISSNMASGDIAQLQAALLSLTGAVSNGSSAGLNATTALAGLNSGLSVAGAQETLTAPPTVAGTSPTDTNPHSLDASCTTLCFGQTAVSGDQTVGIPNGSPKVSSASNQVTVALRRTGSNIYHGFSYTNADPTTVDPGLQLLNSSSAFVGPMVSAGNGATSNVAVSNGYLDATGTGSSSLIEAGQFTMPVLQLFPTSFAPNGVVQVSVDHGSLTCQSGAGTSSVSASWDATVSWYNGATGQYVSYDQQSGAAALPAPSSLVVVPATATSPAITLDHWISAWTGLTSTSGISKGGGSRAVGAVGSIVSIVTVPTRASDPTSALNIGIGGMSCVAEDDR